MMEKYDVIIIGAGPGGYETAIEAAHRGLKTVLFERDKVGGTCLNRGCIPTKALCRSAEVLETVRDAARFGVEIGAVKLDYAVAHARMVDVVDQLRQGVEASLKGVDVVYAEARITPEGDVEADGKVYSAPRVIIATGSRTASLPIPGAELAMNTTAMLAAEKLPESIVIIGGGVAGMEFACVLNSFGVEVTVVEYCKEILPSVESDIAKRLRSVLSRKGIKFVLGAAVTAISREGDDAYRVTYNGKKGEDSVVSAAVLMAVGFRPVFPEGLEAAGIEFTPRGIVVDDKMQTSRPGIYAIGDVNGRFLVAHAATAQGRVALGDDINLNVVPSVVFTSPEISMVGMSTDRLKAAGVTDLKSSTVLYGTSGKALAMGEPFGVVKLTTDPAGQILSCTILGAHAGDLIQEVALAMGRGITAHEMADVIHSHPTLCELVMTAGHNA